MSPAAAIAVLKWLVSLDISTATALLALATGYVKGWNAGSAGCETRVRSAVEATARTIQSTIETEAHARAQNANEAAASLPPLPRDRADLERLCAGDPACRGHRRDRR